MSKRLLRIAIPLFAVGIALGVAASMFFRQPPATPSPGGGLADGTAATEADGSSGAGPDDAGAPGDQTGAGDAPAPASETPPDRGEPVSLDGLHVAEVAAPGGAPAPLGSTDPEHEGLFVEFAPRGGSIQSITCSNIWKTAEARRAAKAYLKARRAGKTPPPLPEEEQRYVLQTTSPYYYTADDGQRTSHDVPLFAPYSIEIDGQAIFLGEATWTELAPGRFELAIENEAGAEIVRIERAFTLGTTYDITCRQHVENRTGQPLRIRWSQYGPPELRRDVAAYMDRRRLRFGYLLSKEHDPQRAFVRTGDSDLLFERTSIVKRIKKSRQLAGDPKIAQLTIWPNETSTKQEYEISWFAAVNRYFAIAIHPTLDAGGVGSKSLSDVVEEIRVDSSDYDAPELDETHLLTWLNSPERVARPGQTIDFDLGIYAGPMDRHILRKEQPYKALAMRGLILYQMSSCCAVCTFQWLAELLMQFLSWLHTYVVFDWGLAIILLVVCVRALLHPITKKAQVNMQRFSKSMTDLKPEIDKLQKKYAGDPKKLRDEQMKLMRERGVNALGCLGFLPMFLQTPIWIALYAMLYFAYDLRHEPAFFGLFQKLTGGHWPFLADLSAGDHCFGSLAEPVHLLFFNFSGFNLLPILMGVVFFIQQKYMTPPPSPSMTPEQVNQQKIMKVMMVALFPVMLYKAPSGLTLYILTSSCIGILESQYIRRHIKEMDLKPAAPRESKPKKKPRDAQARAYMQAMERIEEKKRRQKRGPQKRYKKRK